MPARAKIFNPTGLVVTATGNKAHIKRSRTMGTLCGRPMAGTADVEQVRNNPWLLCQRCQKVERGMERGL